jgi:hypothetical protein
MRQTLCGTDAGLTLGPVRRQASYSWKRSAIAA